MRALPGQAAAYLWMLTYRLLKLCLVLAMLGGVVLVVFAWRLSLGPVDVAWLARQLEAAVATADGPRLSIGSAAIMWEGFHKGVGRPLDIRLTNITAFAPPGPPIGAYSTPIPIFSIPAGTISLSLRALLLGRIEPLAIELYQAHLTAQRGTDGALTLDLSLLTETPPDAAPEAVGAGAGLLNAILIELARPAATDRAAFRDTRFNQLHRVLVSESSLAVIDRQLDRNWLAPRIDIDLRRHAAGGVEGSADIIFAIGAEQARLHLDLRLGDGAQSGQANATLTPITPAALAKLSPVLAELAALDAPVTLAGKLDLGPALVIREGMLHALLGPGRLVLGPSTILVRRGEAAIALTNDVFSLRDLRLEVAATEGGPASVMTATGQLAQEAGLWQGRGRLTLDRVTFADLATLWPPVLAKNARVWVTKNITAGLGHDVQLDLAGTANADFTDVKITDVKGSLLADDLSVHWLRPVPPLEKIQARLEITNPDVMDIHTSSGRQILETTRGEAPSNLIGQTGRVRITGLSQRDQIAYIDLDLAGPVAEIITLLQHPSLRLLDRSPFELRNPGGKFSGHLAVTVPLEHYIKLEDIVIRAQARTEGLRLAGIVAGHNLEQGVLELDATNEAIKITGHATIAAIPAQLSIDLDFHEGGPAQIQQRISASTRADILVLAAAAGLTPAGLASGPVSAQLAYSRRRDEGAELFVTGDLRETTLSFSPLAWNKPGGRPASMEAKLRMERGRVITIDKLSVRGEALDLHGRMEQQGGRLAMLRLERAILGRTDARGTITFLANGGVIAAMEGTTVDLAPRLTTPPRANPPKGPLWSVEANFATALLAHDVRATGFRFQGESDGVVMRRLRLGGQTGSDAFQLRITPEGTVRRLTATAADAGLMLRGINVAQKLSGGTMNVDASYDDRASDRPLTGTARIEDLRVLNAPVLTGLLQAMTLYGLVQLAQGPGLGITHIIAPFRMTDTLLEFQDVRAFNPSLGMTIKGHIDRIRETCHLNGTIVPAYFFNSLLGELPLLGKLFTPDVGGGLFAATYTLRGPLADPEIAVNPLAALTPGFLRNLFDGF